MKEAEIRKRTQQSLSGNLVEPAKVADELELVLRRSQFNITLQDIDVDDIQRRFENDVCLEQFSKGVASHIKKQEEMATGGGVSMSQEMGSRDSSVDEGRGIMTDGSGLTGTAKTASEVIGLVTGTGAVVSVLYNLSGSARTATIALMAIHTAALIVALRGDRW